MPISPLAGLPPPDSLLINVGEVIRCYVSVQPDPANPQQRVSFGTSGHRGTPLNGSFNEAHILAITQAICDYRRQQRISGPLFLGKDTHAVDGPAHDTAVEVLASNGVEVMIASNDDVTPVPLVSHAIIAHNRGRKSGLADGIIVTPSHNPPRDGGIKYNPPNGGPADIDATSWIQERANALMQAGNAGVRRMPLAAAMRASTSHRFDYLTPYVEDLTNVIDMDIIRGAGLHIGADPLGGASVHLWEPIRDRYRLDVTVVNRAIDPTFRFMRVDHDGEIRMDCSSPFAMAGLVALKDHYQIAFGNDTDADRHGIVAPSVGLLPPNHFLAVAIDYLFAHRPGWRETAKVGKTCVSSAIIDRVAAGHGRSVWEVPVGFKWFVTGLSDGTLGFAGEESAGATLLKRDGSPWTTDKDGPVMDLLACELTARSGRDPGELYRAIEQRVGPSFYRREDQPATQAQQQRLKQLDASGISAAMIAGQPIRSVITRAPGNDASIGGVKVSTDDGWFAARPSGTEAIYKIYAESMQSEAHLEKLIEDARGIVGDALGAS